MRSSLSACLFLMLWTCLSLVLLQGEKAQALVWSTAAEKTLEGMLGPSGQIESFTLKGRAAPALSPAGQMRMYFDSATNTWKVSTHGSAYGSVATLSTAQTFTALVTISAAIANRQLFVQSIGANVGRITVDVASAGQQASIGFQDAETDKWVLGKATDNTFFVYDSANALTMIAGATNGDLSLGSTGKLVKLPNIASTSAAQQGTVCWATGGSLTVDTTVACLTSSARFKEHIVSLDGKDMLALVRQLRPVSYQTRREFADLARDARALEPQVGFVAEEIAQLDPRLVGYDRDGQLRGVRYMQLTAILAGAIQQLEERLARIESRRP